MTSPPQRPQFNPFHYGNPVPPSRFIGRADALRTVFGRINNGESTAVVGEPHIGKSSMLHYLRRNWPAWLSQGSPYAFVAVDCHALRLSYTPADFWAEALDAAGEVFADETAQGRIAAARAAGFDSSRLRRVFEQLALHEQRAVLLVDEFDVLLYHPNFNTSDFFGTLRSLAIHTGGLSLVTFSRLSVAEMNRRTHALSQHGSPFFNNLIEVRLQPLQAAEIDALIDQALLNTGVAFPPDDRAYLARTSGRHPFLLQIACAALFDAVTGAASPASRRTSVERQMQMQAASHFEDVWRHLAPDARRAMGLLAYAESVGAPLPNTPAPEGFDEELRWLYAGSLIEPTRNQRCTLWRGARWRVSSMSLARWLVTNRKWEDVAGEASVRPKHAPDDDQRSHAQALIAVKRDRLHKLELQAARLGVNAGPEILSEIEDLQREIAALEGDG
jgi:hypothetical protein